MPQRILAKWAALVWIGGGCLGVLFCICNPLVDGGRDFMLLAVREFLSIPHPLSMDINERVEVIVAEANVHFRHV